MLEDRDEESDEKKDAIEKTVTRFFDSISSSMGRYFCPLPDNKFIRVFYKHPAIKYLGESKWQSKPSYLEPSNFSTTLIKLLRGNEYNGSEPQMNAIYRTLFNADQNKVSVETGKKLISAPIEPETLQQIQQLYTDAQKDIDRFKNLLENWFNQTMDRATGWYKRQTQWILFFIGIFIAISFNVDTIATYRLLSKDKTAREQLVQLAIASKPKYDSLAQSTATKHISVSRTDTLKDSLGKDSIVHRTSDTSYVALTNKELTEAYSTVQTDIESASDIVSLGWPDCDSCKVYRQIRDSLAKSTADKESIESVSKKIKKFHCDGNPYQSSAWLRFLGWILTALAISLGAPFWFELMNKLLQFRGNGPKPKDTAPDTSTNKNNPAGSSPIQRAG